MVVLGKCLSLSDNELQDLTLEPEAYDISSHRATKIIWLFMRDYLKGRESLKCVHLHGSTAQFKSLKFLASSFSASEKEEINEDAN